MNSMFLKQLVDRHQTGDRSAQHTLWRHVEAPLTRWVTRRFRDPEIRPEEVAATAFARALLKLDSWEGDSSFLTWLCAIAGNVACRFRERVEYHACTRSLHDVSPEALVRRESDRDLLSSIDEDFRDLLRASFLVMPVDQVRATVYRFIYKLSRTEMARRLGRPVKAVDALISRAVQTLTVAFELQKRGLDVVSNWGVTRQ